jgi:hypothetical protein
MTPESANHRNEAQRNNRNSNFMSVNGATWTDECKYGCGYSHLTSATKGIYLAIFLCTIFLFFTLLFTSQVCV